MDFEAVIGLEIHVQMKTKSKMFSSSPVSFGDEPNTRVAPLDMAFPGTLPVVNKQVVINALRVCRALNMTIDKELWFDRKNYFYSDSPKGYQITQENRPIGRNGYLEINTSKGKKRIGIKRLHMEEDSCKQLHLDEYTYLDFNRAGIPLLEIVSFPEINNGEEAMKFVEKIRSIVSFLDVSDGKMEEGSLRCDVNISIREKGSSGLGAKVEIKNINTLVNIQKAIDFEINRQTEIICSGNPVIQETRRFDEKTKETERMRDKENSIEYRYFTEPNIIPIRLSQEFIDKSINTSPELAETKLVRYQSLGLNEYDSSLLVSDKNISDYFDEAIKDGANPKLVANWIIGEVFSVLNKNDIEIKDFTINAKRLGKLVKLIKEGKISNKQAREIFLKMIESEDSPEEIISQVGATLINDESEILKVIDEVLLENPSAIIDYKNGKDRAVGFIVGQVMKKTQGKVNPGLTNKLVVQELQRR